MNTTAVRITKFLEWLISALVAANLAACTNYAEFRHGFRVLEIKVGELIFDGHENPEKVRLESVDFARQEALFRLTVPALGQTNLCRMRIGDPLCNSIHSHAYGLTLEKVSEAAAFVKFQTAVIK